MCLLYHPTNATRRSHFSTFPLLVYKKITENTTLTDAGDGDGVETNSKSLKQNGNICCLYCCFPPGGNLDCRRVWGCGHLKKYQILFKIKFIS